MGVDGGREGVVVDDADIVTTVVAEDDKLKDEMVTS